MELHTINGKLYAMPDTVRAHNAVEEWMKEPEKTVARLAALDREAEKAFRAERIAARAAREVARSKPVTAQIEPVTEASKAQKKAAAEAIARAQKAASPDEET